MEKVLRKKTEKERVYTSHPYELAFCGFSRTGKTTLITRLIKEFSRNYKVAYVKHDVHGFDIDSKGKDTYQASQSGAHCVFIGDAKHCAVIQNEPCDLRRYQDMLWENDMAFIEGYKNSPMPKIVFIDEDEKIIDDIQNNRLENIIAFCGAKNARPAFSSGLPYFHRDDIQGVQKFIIGFFKGLTEKVPLYGLILAGGTSARMKKDKSQLHYHGKSQTEYGYELLSKFCRKTFVSNREGQSMSAGQRNLPQIHDAFLKMGPLGGILSAMTAYPRAAWLVLACDLPFITIEALKKLVSHRNPFKMATAYRSATDNLPEPLCAVYEPKSFSGLLKFLALGVNCPRKIFIRSDVALISQGDHDFLENVNSPEEYSRAVKRMKRKKP